MVGADAVSYTHLNFIFAIGSRLGLGAATRYAILRAQGDERSERYFSNALLWALVFALPFMLAGIFCPEVLLRFMGGDAEIVALGVGYARIFLLFTPFFTVSYTHLIMMEPMEAVSAEAEQEMPPKK